MISYDVHKLGTFEIVRQRFVRLVERSARTVVRESPLIIYAHTHTQTGGEREREGGRDSHPLPLFFLLLLM